jgi:hypothetical protein
MTNRALIPNLESILSRFSSQLKDQLASARKDFDGDEQQLFLQQRSIIAKSEAARDAELEKAGLKLPSPVAKIQTLEPGKEKLSEAERLRLKTEKLMALIAAEPPRETITGSFRSH